MPSLSEALEMAGMTDPGRLRAHNEDALLYDNERGIVILADGMGGYNAGEVASAMAVDAMNETLRAALAAMQAHLVSEESQRPVAFEMLQIAVDRANSVVYEHARNDKTCSGMGTTLIGALFYDNRIALANVGDSRLYRLRDAEFSQLSRDHSLLQDQLDAGLITQEEARTAIYRNLVTRAVGVESTVEADIQEWIVLPGDIYLFCSDGLTEMVDDTQIAETLSLFCANLPLAAQTLINQANAEGGKDNISIVLVAVRRDFPVETSWVSRLTAKFL